MPKKLLFVCGRNVDRSPTAENIFKGIAGLEVKSAGVSIGATVPLTRELVKWADEIYCMEFKHQQIVLKMVPSAWKKVESLGIPDIYYRDQPELRQLMLEKMKRFSHLR
ncbi:MAG: phosphotyrosine protein phosphatase [Candidatus Bathyarchaeia archaeon]|jgi:predicted protein tyrosine phosphatase